MKLSDRPTSEFAALPKVRGLTAVPLILCLAASAGSARPETNEELLGTLYLSYMLSDSIPEASWTLVVDALREAELRYPEDVKARVALLFAEGQLARAQKKPDEARARLEKARRLDLTEIHPYLGLAELALDGEDSAGEAKQALAQAVKLLPRAVPEFARHLYLNKIAGLYHRSGDLLQAIALYESIVAGKPDWPHARAMLQQLRMERYRRKP